MVIADPWPWLNRVPHRRSRLSDPIQKEGGRESTCKSKYRRRLYINLYEQQSKNIQARKHQNLTQPKSFIQCCDYSEQQYSRIIAQLMSNILANLFLLEVALNQNHKVFLVVASSTISTKGNRSTRKSVRGKFQSNPGLGKHHCLQLFIKSTHRANKTEKKIITFKQKQQQFPYTAIQKTKLLLSSSFSNPPIQINK